MIMDLRLEPTWQSALKEELKKEYYRELMNFVSKEYESYQCFPNQEDIFSAFNSTPFDKVKVVIIGQDPYHGFGQSHGLCFSVGEGIKIPPSLRNIFKELNSDLNISIPESGNLQSWADQGVLLLNAILTVREAQAGSHRKKGWESFTDAVIQKLSDEREGIVFLLWGTYAKQKGKNIDTLKHHVLESSHPSPLSANREGWFGTKHFSKANKFLENNNTKPINW